MRRENEIEWLGGWGAWNGMLLKMAQKFHDSEIVTNLDILRLHTQDIVVRDDEIVQRREIERSF